MQVERLPLARTGLIPKIAQDYLSGLDRLKSFYQFEPILESFSAATKRKQQETIDRNALVEVLLDQYEGITLNPTVSDNINALADNNTFTVVTAHQPLLFLGPLYFVHKAASAVKTARLAEQQLSGKKVVPIFWLGGEDHDFEEMRFANVFGKKLQWEALAGGPVGRKDCGTISKTLDELESILGSNASELLNLFQEAYAPGRTFSQATRIILHELLGEFGLVVLSADDVRLKKHFTKVMGEELLKQTSSRLVSETNKVLAEHYPIQAEPRNINLFYMLDDVRERIELDNGTYKVINTEITFDESSIIKELEEHPERFSPNVILRGLYQESILPNLAFVGGPAEVSYWLEFRSLFEHFEVSLPMILLRDLVFWLDSNTKGKLEKLGLTTERLFEDEDALIRKLVKESSQSELSLEEQAEQLKEVFEDVSQKAELFDPNFTSTVAAEEQKALNSLKNIEAKMLRAEKRNSETLVNQIKSVKGKAFPNGTFQERFDSFMNVYTREGQKMIGDLVEASNALDGRLKVLSS